MAYAFLGQDEGIQWRFEELRGSKQKSKVEYVLTNRRALTLIDGLVSGQCGLEDATAVVVFAEVVSKGSQTWPRGNVTFLSRTRPVLSFYSIPYPQVIANNANILQSSILAHRQS